VKVLEIFVLMIRQFHRNESSWNVRSRGTKVSRERMFHGTKVLGTFAPEERKFQGANVPWNESSLYIFSLPGTKVQRNEKPCRSPSLAKFDKYWKKKKKPGISVKPVYWVSLKPDCMTAQLKILKLSLSLSDPRGGVLTLSDSRGGS